MSTLTRITIELSFVLQFEISSFATTAPGISPDFTYESKYVEVLGEQ